jgi:hypothetical protein
MDQERAWKKSRLTCIPAAAVLGSRVSSRAGSSLHHIVPAPALAAEAQAHLDLDTLVAAHSPAAAAAAA